MSGPTTQTDTALLFRSVRAARSWLRASGNDLQRPSSCVTMKPGNDEPPVFIIPGATGSILQLAPIAEAIPLAAPVFALRPRGMAGDELPCERLDEMAAYAVGLMRTVRPEGPYLLVGYSAGGLVALEMAQQLTAAGHAVPLVVLLDTYPSRETWPLFCHLDVLARQALRALGALARCKPRQAMAEATRRARSLVWYLAASGMKLVEPPPLIAEGIDPESRRVHVATYNAGEAYRPSRYGGRVVFLQPDEVPNLEPRTPQLVWRSLLPDLTIRRVPGSHLRMLDEGAAATAAEIGRCVAAALSR